VRLEEMAKKYEIPQCFTDFHEMIENGGIDAIVIVSPPIFMGSNNP
jgi:predicted dehydrogenase